MTTSANLGPSDRRYFLTCTGVSSVPSAALLHSTAYSPSVAEAAKSTPASPCVMTAGKKPSRTLPATRDHVLPASEETYRPPVLMDATKIFPAIAKSCTGVDGRPDAACCHIFPASREMYRPLCAIAIIVDSSFGSASSVSAPPE